MNLWLLVDPRFPNATVGRGISGADRFFNNTDVYNMRLFTLFALETGSSSPVIVFEMRAITGPAISLCYPLLSFLLSVLSNEVQLWLPIVCASHIISLSSVLSLWCFPATTSSCQFLLACFLARHCSFLLLHLCFLVDSFFTFHLFFLCLAINHPHPFWPQASFVLSPLPLKSSHLSLYFSKEYSGLCLLFLLVASTRQIGLCQSCVFESRHSRCLLHIALYLSALLSAI